jgi:hypothetical protein
MLVNPAKHPDVKKELGQQFIDWLISPDGQKTIANYKIEGEPLFHVTNTSPFFFDEIVLIDLLALFLAIATVSILWYVVKKALPDEVKDLQFFVTFIFVVVPFVMLVCFGLALINYDAIAARSGWPPILPLSSLSSPPIVGAVAFYIGQTVWLWLGWRKLRKRDESTQVAHARRGAAGRGAESPAEGLARVRAWLAAPPWLVRR